MSEIRVEKTAAGGLRLFVDCTGIADGNPDFTVDDVVLWWKNNDLDNVQSECERLRDLILDMLVDEERGNTEESTYYEHVRLAKELGIEVG